MTPAKLDVFEHAGATGVVFEIATTDRSAGLDQLDGLAELIVGRR